MNKFGLNEEIIKRWKDDSFVMKGVNDTAIILIHGWSAFPRQMKPFAELLNKQGHWVYVPKLTGHGEVPENLEKAKVEDWIKDVEKEIDKVKKNPKIKKVCIGGNSMGGSLSIIGATRNKIDTLFLMGTPVRLKFQTLAWFLVKISSFFNLYFKKSYPKNIDKNYPGSTSYLYTPSLSILECFKVIKKAAQSLNQVTAPTLILQTSQDYMVTKYSPWIIYHRIKSKNKKLQWVQSKYDNHTMTGQETVDACDMINNFILKI